MFYWTADVPATNKRVYAAILIGYLILPMPGNNIFEISDFADQSFFLKAAREPRGCFAPSHSDLIEKLFRNIICFLYKGFSISCFLTGEKLKFK